MYNIKVIFTLHQEAGEYNAHALCKVIQSIEPEVIFEELQIDAHTMAYQCSTPPVLVEINSIKLYLEHKAVNQVPVDTFKLSDAYYRKEDEFYDEVFKVQGTYESRKLKRLIETHFELTSMNGLPFLNSDESELLLKQSQQLHYDIFNQINDNRLKHFELERKDATNKREHEIINNIYRYSESNQYEQAIMLIGSGHRITILNVIEQFKGRETLKLNWTLYEA